MRALSLEDSEFLSVVIPGKLKRDLIGIAKQEGQANLSPTIRRALSEFVKREKLEVREDARPE